MKNIVVFLGVAVLCIVGLTGCPQYQDYPYYNGDYCQFTLHNNSDYYVSEYYLVPSNSDSWGYNRLPYTLAPGETYTFYVPQGYYDMYGVSRGGTTWHDYGLNLYHDYFDEYLWNKGEKSNEGKKAAPAELGSVVQ